MDVRTDVGNWKGMVRCEDGCGEGYGWMRGRMLGRVWVDVKSDVGKGMGGCEDGCGDGYGWM